MSEATTTMTWGIWRKEKRARELRCEAGFVRCPISGKAMAFRSHGDALSFLVVELASDTGLDFDIRPII